MPTGTHYRVGCLNSKSAFVESTSSSLPGFMARTNVEDTCDITTN